MKDNENDGDTTKSIEAISSISEELNTLYLEIRADFIDGSKDMEESERAEKL